MSFSASPESTTPKKAKGVNYKISDENRKLIKKDSLNQKLWKEAINMEKEGYPVRVFIWLSLAKTN